MNDKDQAADASVAREKRQPHFGLKELMFLAVTCAVFAWAGWRAWDDYNTEPATRRFRETLQRLQSSEPAERWRAAGNLGGLSRTRDIELAVPALCRAGDDKDIEVRISTARSLGALVFSFRHPQDDASLPPELVRKWTEEATRALVKLLADPVEMVRVSAVSALGTMARQPGQSSDMPALARPAMFGGGGPARKAAPQPPAELTEALENGSIKWSRATAQKYYGYADEDPAPELVAALKDSSVRVRIAVAAALQNYPLNLDATIPTLLSMLESDEHKVGEVCQSTLRAAWPTPAAVPALVAALASDRAEVRALGAFLLGRIGPEASSAVPALLATLKEPLDPATPRIALAGMQQDPPCSAARALGEISSGDDVIAALTETLKSDLAYRHGAAADGLARIGPRAAVAAPALLAAYTKWLDSKDPLDTGRAMTIALGRLAPKTATEAGAVAGLVRALDSKDGRIRQRAAESLAKFGTGAAAAVPKLRDLTEKSHSEPLRKAARAAIAAIEAPSQPQTGQSTPR
jgi:HEAT repeat protein